MFEALRFPLKSAGFVAWTGTLYGLLEAQTLLTPPAEREALVRLWQRRYGRGLLRLYGVELETTGLPAGGLLARADARGVGRLFVMNHRAALDIFVCLANVEATLVSRADLAGWPVIGAAARRVGTLFVDRTSRASGAALINAMSAALEAGRGIMVFPEGTTFSGDEVRPFQPGAFLAASRVGAEVWPLGLAYEREELAFGEEAFPSHMRRVSRARHVRAALEVGRPLESAADGASPLRARAHQAVQALVHRARARLR